MDIERTMQFILEQQARHEASASKHDEEMADLRSLAAEHSEQIATVTDLVGRLAQAEIRLAERMQGHESRLQSLETKMTMFLERMDRFIQGLEGNGHKSR